MGGFVECDSVRSATTSSLLAKDMTARDGMGHVGPAGIALEADVARRIEADHEHDDRERKGLAKDPLSKTLKRRINGEGATDISKERAALLPGQDRVLAWIGASTQPGACSTSGL